MSSSPSLHARAYTYHRRAILDQSPQDEKRSPPRFRRRHLVALESCRVVNRPIETWLKQITTATNTVHHGPNRIMRARPSIFRAINWRIKYACHAGKAIGYPMLKLHVTS